MAREFARRGHQVSAVPLSSRAASICQHKVAYPEVSDMVLLDVPYPGDEAVRRAREMGAQVVALDYEGLVAPEAVISLQKGRSVPSGAQFYVGIEYAIIREELRLAKSAQGATDEVLVVLGGGDFQGLSLEVARRLPSVPLCIVQGPAAEHLKIERDRLRVLHSPTELPQLMSQCAWAVTSGGTTMLEMLFLGKAVHVVPRTEDEERFARQFGNKGAIIGEGLEDLRVPEATQKRSCEAMGPKLIDGRGAQRIAVIVEGLL